MKGAAVIISVLLAGQAAAAETTTYTYDALGRLVRSVYQDGPRSGSSAAIRLDAADNRIEYAYGLGTPTPPPSPPPPPPNNTTMTPLNPAENLAPSRTYSNLLPGKFVVNGVNPLIQSFNIPAGGGTATIVGGGTSVTYTTPANRGIDKCSVADDKIVSIQVVVRDSTSATVTSTYTVTVAGVVGTASPCF